MTKCSGKSEKDLNDQIPSLILYFVKVFKSKTNIDLRLWVYFHAFLLVCFRCVRGVTGIQNAPSACPSRGSPRLSWSVSLVTAFMQSLNFILKHIFVKDVIELNSLHQIWTDSQCHVGQLVKALHMCPSHSLTWTSDPTDLWTVVM